MRSEMEGKRERWGDGVTERLSTGESRGGEFRFALSLPVSSSPRLPVALPLLMIAWLIIATLTASAATPFNEYASRVEQAAKMVKPLLKGEHEETEVRGTLKVVEQMLPTTEDIEFDHEVVHVDNTWLHQAISALKAEKEARQQQVAEIYHRLSALERRLKPGSESAKDESAAERARLQSILSRPEYQPEAEKESTIQKWINEVKDAFWRLMSRIFSAGGMSAPNATTILLLRILIYLAVGFAIILAGRALARRLHYGAQRKAKGEVREVLGEQIEDHVTAEDLIKAASDLARAGEYRLAIRRAYIALLYELEQRGKLRLHRSKTNRDYLRALSDEPTIYPPVADLTNAYERVWYGHARAVSEDYAGFIARYREALAVDS